MIITLTVNDRTATPAAGTTLHTPEAVGEACKHINR